MDFEALFFWLVAAVFAFMFLTMWLTGAIKL
jgi:hypothetical protein